MWNIIGKKNWYFLFSLLIIVPGVISLILYGLQLSIDFTGGSRVTLLFEKNVTPKEIQVIRETYTSQNVDVAALQTSGRQVFLRTKPQSEREHASILQALDERLGDFRQEQFETIGPTIGREITLNAVKAIAIGSVLIVLYIAWSFRKVPKPASSWKFGVVTIFTLLHDVLLLLGIFSLLGHFLHVEVDTLFLTALLTVMGFSVHDTIVVFDRIRENLLRNEGQGFAAVVNNSIIQTLNRSLNTSITALLVLFTMLLFGGDTLFWFILALFIGVAAGTYSSIFNAAPLLVLWNEIDQKRKRK